MNKRTQYFRHISLLILLLIGLLVYSQNDKSTTSNKDTLYIYFKHGKNERIKGPNLISPPDTRSTSYYFDTIIKNNFILFEYVSRIRNKQRELIDNTIIIKPKRLLKKNKNRVYTYCKLKKMGSKKTFEFYIKNKHKIIYLIDKKENKDCKIFLRKVTFSAGFRIVE